MLSYNSVRNYLNIQVGLLQGTDITEAFESHHLSAGPEKLLPKFHVREASTPRNSPFTFHENGFYKTLKRNVVEVLVNLPEWPRARSKIIIDSLLGSFLVSAFLSVYFWSFAMGALAGFLLNGTVIAAHNYFHQKDNFRMYYFDLSMMSSRSWRISHVMSHHMYTNTINDIEISVIEPLLQFLPQKKSIFVRYVSWVYFPVIYILTFFLMWGKETLYSLSTKKFSLKQLIPLLPFMGVCLTSQVYLPWVVLMYAWILMGASFWFTLVGLNAGHHHPDVFHDGDTPRPREELDWGIHQVDAVMDRNEITGSHILVLTSFGDHALHHLFPTIDHGHLEYLYPVFKSTCKQFGIDFRMTSQLKVISGQFRQLAKETPTSQPPQPLKKAEGNSSEK